MWTRHVKRSEEHTSELQSQSNLVCRLLLEKKNMLAQAPHHEGLSSARGIGGCLGRAADIGRRAPPVAVCPPTRRARFVPALGDMTPDARGDPGLPSTGWSPIETATREPMDPAIGRGYGWPGTALMSVVAGSLGSAISEERVARMRFFFF